VARPRNHRLEGRVLALDVQVHVGEQRRQPRVGQREEERLRARLQLLKVARRRLPRVLLQLGEAKPLGELPDREAVGGLQPLLERLSYAFILHDE